MFAIYEKEDSTIFKPCDTTEIVRWCPRSSSIIPLLQGRFISKLKSLKVMVEKKKVWPIENDVFDERSK